MPTITAQRAKILRAQVIAADRVLHFEQSISGYKNASDQHLEKLRQQLADARADFESAQRELADLADIEAEGEV